MTDSRIIVALDNMCYGKALDLAARLQGTVAGFKVNDLLDECGQSICSQLKQFGIVMADPKLKDIPATMRNRAAKYRLNTDLLTVHASNTIEALIAAREGAGKDCKILGVTVLTSMASPDVCRTYSPSSILVPLFDPNDTSVVEEAVLRFAKNALDADLYGIVCSSHEIFVVKKYFGNTLNIVVPGVRSQGSNTHDQKRTMTPAEAVTLGVDLIVVGREITESPDPMAAADRINSDIRNR